MKIICHRGDWINKSEQNSISAIQSSFQYDGVEIDLRSYNNEIALSHDPLTKKKFPLLRDIFERNPRRDFFWALNIKEDGLSKNLRGLISEYGIENYMCFDLSFPENVIYKKLKLAVFDRYGDLEPHLPESKTLVLDCFNSRNFKQTLLKCNQKKIFVISPELHGQPYRSAWKFLKENKNRGWLCTDHPHEAQKFFS